MFMYKWTILISIVLAREEVSVLLNLTEEVCCFLFSFLEVTCLDIVNIVSCSTLCLNCFLNLFPLCQIY